MDILDKNMYNYFSKSHLHKIGRGLGEPLKKDIRVSSSKEQIFELLQMFKDKNVKKGWTLVK